jgi:hypothetical protein
VKRGRPKKRLTIAAYVGRYGRGSVDRQNARDRVVFDFVRQRMTEGLSRSDAIDDAEHAFQKDRRSIERNIELFEQLEDVAREASALFAQEAPKLLHDPSVIWEHLREADSIAAIEANPAALARFAKEVTTRK